MLQHLIEDLNSRIAYALLWTLIHSLWQGILTALIAALIINNTKKSTAVIRYRLLVSLLCGFMLISLITFYYEINLQLTNHINVQSTIDTSGNYVKNFVAGNPLKNFISKAVLYIQFYKNYIIIVWLMIVVLKCISMLAGLRYIYRLKHKQVFDAGEFWNEWLKELAAKLNITKSVIFLKSTIVEIPMTAGHLKPVILFPAAALTNLYVENIEAILLHELAHIRRNDYLLNLLQSFADIIFFFNPAVLWLSLLIKEERENCCDDIALHQTKNKKQFIRALAAFKNQEIFMQQAVLFSGTKYHLLNRLKRIITNNNKTLNTMEKTLLSTGVIITLFAAVAFTKIKHPLFSVTNHKAQPVIANLFKKVNDTLPLTTSNDSNTRTVISHSFNGRRYRLIETNGRKELYINDIKIPDDKISNYNDVIEKLEQQIVIDKKNQNEAMKAQAEALAAQAESMKENELAMADETKIKDEESNALAQQMNDSNKAQEELESQTKDLQQQAEAIKDEMKTKTSAQQRVALKAEAIALQQQAVAMKAAMKNKSVQMQKEALKAQAEYMNQENVIKKAQLHKQMEQLRIEQKTLVEQSEIMKQQQLKMKAEMDKQSEIMKQQEIQMKADIEKQNEQLKEQNEKLVKQLNRERDSLSTVKPIR